MTRTLLALTAFAGLAAWAGAQPSAQPPIAADQLRQFRTNLSLLEGLLEDGLRVADAGDPVEQAGAYRKAAWTLVAAVRSEANGPDPSGDRVAELSDHLAAVVRDGLAPTLAAAKSRVPPNSREFEQLRAVHRQAKQDLAAAGLALGGDGPFGQSPKVVAARAALDAAAETLGTVE